MSRLSNLKCLAYALMVILSCVSVARADVAAQGPSGGPRVALVVGNSNYGGDLGVLPNPVNDSRLVATALRHIGFDVIEVEDADQNALKRAIAAFGDRMAAAGSDATSLFFYAGHGLQVGGQNYLIPVHAEISRERDVDIEAVSLDTVLRQMAFADSKVNIVILDACRNNPLSRGFRSATKGLAEVTQKPQGSFISYSTAPGDVAVDGNGANSPFSAALVEAIEKPGLDINDVFREVRADVMSATKGKQVPWDSSSLTAPYYFVAPAAEAPAAPAPLQTALVDPKTIELTFWEAIKDSKAPDDFAAYLEKYPTGDFAALARIRVKQLGAAPAAPVPAAETIQAQPADRSPDLSADIELTYWNSVKDVAEKEGFQAYLKKYPKGHFADLARARLADLETQAKAEAALTPPPAPPKIQEMDATFVAKQSANVRAEPGTEAKVIARLKEDDAVAVTGKVEGKDWYRAKVDAGTGYISGSLLQPADADAIAAWQAAKKAGTVEAVQSFVKRHPGSVFEAKAKKLLASLQPPAAPKLAEASQPAAVAPQPPAAATFSTAAATAEKPAIAAAPIEQAAALPAAPDSGSGLHVGDTFDVNARGTVGISGGWWGNTRVTLVIERATGENAFEGKLTGSGEFNFWEECDIEVEGEKLTIRGTSSSVENKPDVLRLKRVAPGRYEGRAQSGSFQGTATMTLKSRG
ncbi:caspase family protein [Dongia sedimenti]|uniref:Caspase family protein n=1 Tax=Dongia sedimenti TaxID=3064282 RepID=A0ABU0YIE6_9PROT|nr:caspase family protein [Rhodospirillaceae bacterium R-7]